MFGVLLRVHTHVRTYAVSLQEYVRTYAGTYVRIDAHHWVVLQIRYVCFGLRQHVWFPEVLYVATYVHPYVHVHPGVHSHRLSEHAFGPSDV
jgi:hypothetical protein